MSVACLFISLCNSAGWFYHLCFCDKTVSSRGYIHILESHFWDDKPSNFVILIIHDDIIDPVKIGGHTRVDTGVARHSTPETHGDHSG